MLIYWFKLKKSNDIWYHFHIMTIIIIIIKWRWWDCDVCVFVGFFFSFFLFDFKVWGLMKQNKDKQWKKANTLKHNCQIMKWKKSEQIIPHPYSCLYGNNFKWQFARLQDMSCVECRHFEVMKFAIADLLGKLVSS